MGREWIKIHVDKWLDGSIRRELTEAQRGIWSDLLALAGRYYREGKREGLIPLRPEDIRSVLKSRARVFEKALTRLIDTDRVKITEEGLEIINFALYNPSRQQIYEDRVPEARKKRVLQNPTPSHASLQSPTQSHTERDRERDKDNIIIATASEEQFLNLLFSLPSWEGDSVNDLIWLREFLGDFPSFGLADVKACRDYHSGRVLKGKLHKGIWKSRLRNWATKRIEFAKTVETPVERYETLEELEAREGGE